MKRNFLLSSFFILLFTGCSVLKIQRPPESYEEVKITPPVSFISIPVEADLKKMENLLNKQFRGLIYADTSFDNNDKDDLMVKAWKSAEIRLTIQGNLLYYSVPLSVWIRKKFSIGAFGFDVSDSREVTGSIILKFHTRVVLQKDWTLSALTTSDGYEWVTTPTLQLAPGISIPLPFISDLLLASNQKNINSQIDKAFQSALNLKASFQPVWNSLQVPFKLSDEYPLWAKITPLEISTVPLQGSSNVIHHTLGIKAYTELFYGSEPAYQVNETIPDLKITSRLDNDFNISLALDVPINEINEIASKQLVGYKYREGKYLVEVRDVFLFGSGDKLVVALNIDGSIQGTIYLSGKPYYDRDSSSLKVRDLDFDIRTKNVLVKSASWLLHQNLIQTLSQQLSFPVGEQLQSARNQLQGYLDRNKKMEYFTISGTIDKPEIGDILITRQSIKAMIIFRGKINVTIEAE
ncbi:MAG: DUF4403 family protein [Bacteroidetes bacterium]|nr:DUF4403 family protein [Bacteroidota bacterium]